MRMTRFRSVSMVVALVGIFCPSHAGRAGRMLWLRAGSPAAIASVANGADEAIKKRYHVYRAIFVTISTLFQGVDLVYFSLTISTNLLHCQVASSIGSTRLCHKNLSLPGYAIKSSKTDAIMGATIGSTLNELSQKDMQCFSDWISCHGMIYISEGPLAVTMQQIVMHERTLLVEASRCRAALSRLATLQKIIAARQHDLYEAKEVERWKMSTVIMQSQLSSYLGSAGNELSDLLGKKTLFSQALEHKYRAGTYQGIPVYGAVRNDQATVFTYLPETELHLVWDIDLSKLVGEGTNDVELVIKCVLWWKEDVARPQLCSLGRTRCP
jgi:hypothetical protein